MTRDRRRTPLLLESLETKQLLSTLHASLGSSTAGIGRQAGTTALDGMAARPSPLAGMTSLSGLSRISHAAESTATGRVPTLNAFRLGLISRSMSGNLGSVSGQGSTRLNLSAGSFSPVARVAVAPSSTGTPIATPGGSSQIVRDAPAPMAPASSAPVLSAVLARNLTSRSGTR